MSVPKKYTLLAAFVVLLVLPTLLVTVLQAGRQVLQQTATLRFARHHTQTIRVAATQVHWEKADREIRLGDRHFDVSSWHRVGDHLILTGHFDDAETLVWQSLKQALGLLKAPGFEQLLLLPQCLLPLTLLQADFRLDRLFAAWQVYQSLPFPCWWALPQPIPPRQLPVLSIF